MAILIGPNIKACTVIKNSLGYPASQAQSHKAEEVDSHSSFGQYLHCSRTMRENKYGKVEFLQAIQFNHDKLARLRTIKKRKVKKNLADNFVSSGSGT